MEAEINNRLFRFQPDVWITSLDANDPEVTFEVYNDTMDKAFIGDILLKWDEGFIHKLMKEALPHLQELSLRFWKKNLNPEFRFIGITVGLTQPASVDFCLCYHMHSEQGSFSDYANWMVDIKNDQIIGCHREQL